MMNLRVILKGILKEYFILIISSLVRILVTKYKLGLRIFLLFPSRTEFLVRYPFCVLHGLREEKNEEIYRR